MKGFAEQIAIIVRVVDVSDSEVLEAILAESLLEKFEEITLRDVGEPSVPVRRRTVHRLRIDELRQIRFGSLLQELGLAQVSLLIAERDGESLAEPGLLGHLQ